MAPTSIPVPLGGRSYNVHLGHEIVGDDLCTILQESCPAPQYAIIADSTVARLYGAAVVQAVQAFARCEIVSFSPGETHKTRETWSQLTDELLAAGVGRDCAIIALGGGVTGDVAGFVAATFMRGIPYVQMPTTVLAMIDSSVGGKTGVNTPLGKNLVGAFHQPSAVIADVSFLKTLPAREYRAGFAEAIKHGAIADRDYFDKLTSARTSLNALDGPTVIEMVGRSIEIKAGVVARDERESGPRAMLNAGHTVAHALETSSNYTMLHGEAVAVGLVLESQLGEHLGITDPGTSKAIADTLRLYDLPVSLPTEIGPEIILEAARSDKKNRHGQLCFSLFEDVGQIARTKTGSWTFEVAESDFTNSLNRSQLS